MPDESPARCPDCGAEIPVTAPAGLCVACLLGLGAADAERISAMETPGPGSQFRYLGDYEIVRELGRGGMGVVYAARQRSLDRAVALKLILAGPAASELDIARFREEAEAIAGLDHPNIVPIYEVGEHEGRHFYGMKLLPGGSLEQQRARFAGQFREIAGLLTKVARAVHFAHQHGILHRDLKPANLLFDAEGEPYVTDFGLVRHLDRDRGLTRTAILPGTPDYLAPERVTGKGQLTTASDQWSLGVILYELLAGVRPFAASTVPELLRRIAEDEPPRPSNIRQPGRPAAIPRDLETICLKCLAKDPARRYPSTAALADDLERWLRGEPVQARAVGGLERTAKWMRRHPWKVAALLASLLAILIPATMGFYLLLRLNHMRGTHPIHFFANNQLELRLINHRGGRCTDNFDTAAFRLAGRPVERTMKVEFENLPDPVRTNLAVVMHCDWAGLDDPARSGPLRHGDTLTLRVNYRRFLADVHFYFMESGWDAGVVLSNAPDARLRLTLLPLLP